MAQQIINLGTLPNDGTGDPLRIGGQKINGNFTDLYGGSAIVNIVATTISGTTVTGITVTSSIEVYPTTNLTLVNGLNSNIAVTASRHRITGPRAAFSVGGFTPVSDGRKLYLYNSTAQQMTLVNEDASSTAANRIKTLTGANVVLRTGTSFATFSYDATDARWILESNN